jgi:hypothetical protein
MWDARIVGFGFYPPAPLVKGGVLLILIPPLIREVRGVVQDLSIATA